METENVSGEGNGNFEGSSESEVRPMVEIEPVVEEYEVDTVTEVVFNVGRVDYWGVVKKFLSLTGGSVFYCLSGLSIIYGVGQIIGPALADSEDVKESIPAVFVMNIYELCLLGALVFIVVRRKVTDDAVSLILLIALFLVGTGLILGTVAPTGSMVCIYAGIVCVWLAAWKIHVLRKCLSMKISKLCFGGLMVILMWNFLGSPWMAYAFVKGEWPEELRRWQWMLSWLVLFIGAGVVIADAILTKDREIHAAKRRQPFIRSHAMVRIFCLVILGAMCGHQYAIGYMFVIDTVWGDYLPVAAAFVILVMELMRCMGRKFEIAEVIVAGIPLAAVVIATQAKMVDSTFVMGPGLIAYPPVLLGIIGGVIFIKGWLQRNKLLMYAAIAYGFGILLMFGFSPSRPYDLNWKLFGVGVVATVLILGIVKKNAVVCFAAVVMAASGLVGMYHFRGFVHAIGMSEIGGMAGVAGLGTMVICMFFGRKTHRMIVLVGALCVMVAVFDCLSGSGIGKDLLVGCAVAGMSVGLWRRTDNIAEAAVMCSPVLVKVFTVSRNMSSWGFVVLSFVLLLTGMSISSLRKQTVNEEKQRKV